MGLRVANPEPDDEDKIEDSEKPLHPYYRKVIEIGGGWLLKYTKRRFRDVDNKVKDEEVLTVGTLSGFTFLFAIYVLLVLLGIL